MAFDIKILDIFAAIFIRHSFALDFSTSLKGARRRPRDWLLVLNFRAGRASFAESVLAFEFSSAGILRPG